MPWRHRDGVRVVLVNLPSRDCLQRRLNRTGIKDPSMRSLCGDAEEVDLGYIFKSQSLTDNMDSAKKPG
jgi:hypothetical protein